MVISDLHLFSSRSTWNGFLDTFNVTLQNCEILVLNGDIFDFQWTTLRSIYHTVIQAEHWILTIMERYPKLTIHYILGNHDCHHLFTERLFNLADRYSSFYIYKYYFQLGSLFFLHGDCANWRMTFEQHKKYRCFWNNITKLPCLFFYLYNLLDVSGATKLINKIRFPQNAVARRAIYYLSTLPEGFPINLKQIYIGHTHLPFNNFMWDGYTFHNTGSAIRNMECSILDFEITNDV